MKRSLLFASLCLCLTTLVIGSGLPTAHAAPITLKLGHISAPGGEVDKQAQKFKELVETKSRGALKIMVYPAQQMGNMREMLEGLSLGTNDMTLESLGFLASYEKDFNYFNSLFLFKNHQEIINHPLVKELLERVRVKQGIRTLSYNATRPQTQIFTKAKPVRTLEDLKGVKLRVPVKSYVDVMNGLGAMAVVIPWGETYMALAQNVVDGMVHNAVQVRDEKFYEHLKYATIVDSKPTLQCIWISEAKYRSLSPELQKIVTESAVESGEFVNQGVKKDDEKAWADLKKTGLTVITVDKEVWFQKARPVLKKMEESGNWSKGLLK